MTLPMLFVDNILLTNITSRLKMTEIVENVLYKLGVTKTSTNLSNTRN